MKLNTELLFTLVLVEDFLVRFNQIHLRSNYIPKRLFFVCSRNVILYNFRNQD